MKRLAPLCALLLAGLFALLAARIGADEDMFFDLPLMFWMHRHASAPLDRIMVAVTWLGSSIVLVPVALAALWKLRLRGRDAVYFVLAFGGAALLSVALKSAFGRIRPHYWTPLVGESSYSFPSGHATQSAALVAALLILCWRAPRRGVLMGAGIAYVAAVGVSRVYAGVHYPSDVLAGWCVAGAWCLGVALALGTVLPPPAR